MASSGFYLLDYNPGTRQWGYPRRGAVLSGTCIVHTAECARDDVGEDTSAEGSARFIANRADYGSYHRLVDSDSIIKMLPWEYEAWQDSQTNPWAVGISFALRTSDWAVMPADRRERYYRNGAKVAAEFVRYMATKGVTVPLKRITGAQARARVPGFCAHGDSGLNRTDPGANFNWPLFFKYTQEALDGINYAGGTEEEVALTQDEINRVAAAVWAYRNEGLEHRDTYQVLREAAVNKFTNQYGVELSLGEQLGWIDKNVNDYFGLLSTAIANVAAPVVLSGEDVEAIANTLKETLAPAVVAELVRRLSE